MASESSDDGLDPGVRRAVAFADVPLEMNSHPTSPTVPYESGDEEIADGVAALAFAAEPLPVEESSPVAIADDDALGLPLSDADLARLRPTAKNGRMILERGNQVSAEERRKLICRVLCNNEQLHHVLHRICCLVAFGWVWTDNWGGCYLRKDDVNSSASGPWEWRWISDLSEWQGELLGTPLPEAGGQASSARKRSSDVPVLSLPASGSKLEDALRPAVLKSKARGTSAAAAAAFQPKSRLRGDRKQEGQYAAATSSKRRAEAGARGGRKHRHGTIEGPKEAGVEVIDSADIVLQAAQGRPSYEDVPYAPLQEPGRSNARRRRDVSERGAVRFASYNDIVYSRAEELGAFLIDHKFVQDRRGQSCRVCERGVRARRGLAQQSDPQSPTFV